MLECFTAETTEITVAASENQRLNVLWDPGSLWKCGYWYMGSAV